MNQQTSPRYPRLSTAAALLLAALALLALPGAAHAQWTQPDANNNISNTNTGGNVGVGTSAPTAELHVVSRAPGLPAVKVRGASGQTANLLEFRTPDDNLRSYVSAGGSLFFNPAMDEVGAAITLAPHFNGKYYATTEHNTFVIDGANMLHYGLYTNPTVRMFLIKDVNGYNAVEVNKIGMTTFRGDMRNRGWVTNIHVDSSGAYYANTADGLLINGTGLTNHGMYTGGALRMLRVVGTGEALAVTRENLTGFGTLAPGARVEIVGTGSTAATASLSVKNSGGAPALLVRDSGAVGIGTGNPDAAYKLDVAGSVNASGLCLGGACKANWSEVGGGQWSSSGTADISNTNTGNVGVGVTSPAVKLHVGGGARVDGGATGRVYLGTGAAANARGLELIEENATTFSIRHHDPGVAWRNIVINPYAGSVGVNTLRPLGPLSVGDSSVAGSDGFIVLGKKTATGGTRQIRMGYDSNFNFVIGDYGNNNTAGAWTSQFAINWQAPSNSLYINSAGKVGIGTGSPGAAYKLDVAGSVNASGLCIADVCKSSWSEVGGGTSQWANNSATGAIYYNSGSVGVGTAGPDQRLGVQGMAGFYPQAWVQPTTRGMFMGHFGTAASIYAFNYPAGTGDSLALTGGTLDFGVYPNGGGGSRTQSMVIANDGRVGIRTASPSHTLEVAGTIHATEAITGATINATYQDVAEWVPSTQKLSAGTVVVLDADRTNHVVASRAAYDTKVAGVISEQPGLLLGVGGEGKLMVATTGRVRVRVDATRAPIRIGDLIVTSDRHGMAMRSEPISVGGRQIHAPGTIIGKALEPLEKGVGEILVLLSLQ